MELKASVLEWLLELGIPEDQLPLASYVPQSATGSIAISEEAESALLNGKGTWAIVTHVLKSRGKTLPFAATDSNPLKRGRTAIDRLHNWSFIERLLSTVGIIVDPDAKALAVAGDCDAVASILAEIRDFCVPKAGGGGGGRLSEEAAKLLGEVEEVTVPGESYAEEIDRKQIADEVSLAVGDVSAPSDLALDAGDADDLLRGLTTSVSMEGKDIYQMPKGPVRSLEDSDSCAQFFIRSISRHFGTDHSESLRFLIDDSGIIEDWIVRGYPAGKYEPVISWLNEVIGKVTDLCFHIASEPSTLSVSLSLISTGVRSKNREVALTTCFLLKQAIVVLEKYFLWKASKKWLTSSIGALMPMVQLMNRFPDAEVSQSITATVRAFYKEDFPQVFLPDITDVCRGFSERAAFLREMMHAIAADHSVDSKITNDSVSLLFQYFMEQLQRAQSDFEKNPLIDALTVCWEHFDIHPNVEIRIKTILGHIQTQCRSPFAQVRHSSISHLFSLFEHLLRNGEDLMSTCQQAVMACYVENYMDIFVHQAILKNLLKILEKYDCVPLSLPVSRLISKIMEEGVISSLQLQVVESISIHPNLGIGDAISLFKLMLNLSTSQGSHGTTCMKIVVDLLDRVGEEEEAILALRMYQERFSGVRVKRKSKKADFLSRIDIFLKQREDFAFVSKNLDQQFLATIGDAPEEEGNREDYAIVSNDNDKENYIAANPLAKQPKKKKTPAVTPRYQMGLKGVAKERSETKYNARVVARPGQAKASRPSAENRGVGGRRQPNHVKAVTSEPKKVDRQKEKKPARSKEEVMRMKERHRKEIEEIKLRREKKEEALKKKEQERLEKEEQMRLRHIQKRNQIVKKMSVPKAPKHASPEDSEMISELVMEALKRRLEANPDTQMPPGYSKSVEPTFYSDLIDGYKEQRGEDYAQNAHMCLSLLSDIMQEKLQIPARANLLGTIVVKRIQAEETPHRAGLARKRGDDTPASQPPARERNVRKKPPRAAPPSTKAKSARYYRRSPMYRPVQDMIVDMIHQAVKRVARKSKSKWKPKPNPVMRSQTSAQSTEDRLKYWNMRKQKENAEKEEVQKKKSLAEKEEQAKRKARSDFLKKKLERQKQEKEERDKRMIEEAKKKQVDQDRQKALAQEKEKARRLAQKEKLQMYKEQKAREAKELEEAKLQAKAPKSARKMKKKPTPQES
ncbi:hypothetical protein HOP50_10g59280 [Chloropicon primus]|uniref:Uncharacterized protein n=1 Tax=Chloropicon primus TaxID=1764295 RepID=A0A5B8MVE8_9CHLO|nr:hypothetical protein A3770_10p59080 [Chloropicon primus]UPR02602.1 hypothetical protein HOP50_10g59280 [Chloropicon primus]|eukprot:QDZ23390.1 hypothetical protein A3770_10p59080 [Chloropicon primus]